LNITLKIFRQEVFASKQKPQGAKGIGCRAERMIDSLALWGQSPFNFQVYVLLDFD
jgi:hypothetical protein